MEGKILINQKLPLEVQHFDTCTFISQKYTDTNEEECVDVESKNRRQLALAICPELQQELEKAKELLKSAQFVFKFVDPNRIGEVEYDQVCKVENSITTFLEGSGNKNK